MIKLINKSLQLIIQIKKLSATIQKIISLLFAAFPLIIIIFISIKTNEYSATNRIEHTRMSGLLIGGALVGCISLFKIYAAEIIKILDGFYTKAFLAALGYGTVAAVKSYTESFIEERFQSSPALFGGLGDFAGSVIISALSIMFLCVAYIIAAILLYKELALTYGTAIEKLQENLLTLTNSLTNTKTPIEKKSLLLEFLKNSLRELKTWIIKNWEKQFYGINAIAGATCVSLAILTIYNMLTTDDQLNMETFLEMALVKSSFEENEIKLESLSKSLASHVSIIQKEQSEIPEGKFSLVIKNTLYSGYAPRKFRCRNLQKEDLVLFVNPSDAAPCDAFVAHPLYMSTGTGSNPGWGKHAYEFSREFCDNSARPLHACDIK